jgi:hypothetical protein
MGNRSAYQPTKEVIERERLRTRAKHLLGYCDELIRSHTRYPGQAAVWNTDLAMYYYTRYEGYKDKACLDECESLLVPVLEGLRYDASYVDRPGGLLYLVNAIGEWRLAGRFPDGLAFLREACMEGAKDLILGDRNDFIHGSFGILFALLWAPDSRVRNEEAGALMDMIHAHAVQDASSFWIRSIYKGIGKEEIDFGFLKGQTAYLLILLHALEEGIDMERNYAAIIKGINQVLQARQELDMESNQYSVFPQTMDSRTGEKLFTNRLSWCYGDLNEAILLYRAADTLDDKNYRKIADIVGTSSIGRLSEEHTLCVDSGFCFGASGVAQLYKTLYSLRRADVYENAYITWIGKTLDLLETDLRRNRYKGLEADLLDGLIGVSLVLLSFLFPGELTWSKGLLM